MEKLPLTKTDAEDNGISCGTADEDGIFIRENSNRNKVYIYYSEINKVIRKMQKLKSRHDFIRGNKVSTKRTKLKTHGEYKNVLIQESV